MKVPWPTQPEDLTPDKVHLPVTLELLLKQLLAAEKIY